MSLELPPVWRWGDPIAPLQAAVERGAILALPTESSYGLGVDPRDARAVAAVFRVKSREGRNPLPVVISDLDQLEKLGIDRTAPGVRRLAHLWPAALSVLLPTRAPLPAMVGESTLAVRVPAHARLRELLAWLGRPLTATSANRSGEPPLLEAAGVRALLAGEDAVVIDEGVLPGGPPSTLVAWREGRFDVLRAGRFPVDRLQELEAGWRD